MNKKQKKMLTRIIIAAVLMIAFKVINTFVDIPTDHGFFTFGTDCCQLRIFLDLDTPSLVVGKMPVECVHIM